MSTSKMKFRFKLTGLEIEIEGTREEVNTASAGITSQLKGLTQLNNLMNPNNGGSLDGAMPNANNGAPVYQLEPPKKKRTRKPGNGSSTSASKPDVNAALDAKFGVEKYGTPKQEWKGPQKAMWILYVIRQELGIDEMPSAQIVNTFNKHFKQATKINVSNLPRDLGKLKLSTPPPVGEDSTKTPSRWYLTDEGSRLVQSLIAQQKGNGVS